MIDFMMSLLANAGAIAIVVLILSITGLVKARLNWALLSLVLISLYFAALFMGGQLIPLNQAFPELSYNWGGKVAAILLWILTLVLLLKLRTNFTAAEAGFTLSQRPGSILPATIATILFVAIHIVISLSLGDSSKSTTEDFFFQMTMPGLDEEPMFRGILLYIMSLAIVSSRFNVLGAKINVAGLLLVVLFGLVHGVMYSNGEWQFSALPIVITGAYGFVLLWLRERTGSLVFPIIAHNLVNSSGLLV